jgi:chromate transporter
MTNLQRPPLNKLLLYFLKLGLTGFGGPVALVGYMQRDLIENRKWFTQKNFSDGLGLAQLCPGPVATQLAMYLGWLANGFRGAFLAGFCLALPAFLIVLALCAFYVHYGELPHFKSAFEAMQGTVLAVICVSAYRLFKKMVWPNKDLWFVTLSVFASTILFGKELFWVFLGAGVVTVLLRHHKSKVGVLLFTFPGYVGQDFATLKKLSWYFFEVGAMVFGSGMVIVPFLYQGVVRDFGWLTDSQFRDALSIALVTPGPVVITVAFMGFLVSGLPGAVLSTFGIFAPCYLFTILVAPLYQRLANQNRQASAFVDGMTAAAVGSILASVLLIGQRTAVDPFVVVTFFLTLVLLLRFKVPEVILILGTGVISLFVR